MAEGFSNAKDNSSRQEHKLCTTDLGRLVALPVFQGRSPHQVAMKEKCSICIDSLEFEVFGEQSLQLCNPNMYQA